MIELFGDYTIALIIGGAVAGVALYALRDFLPAPMRTAVAAAFGIAAAWFIARRRGKSSSAAADAGTTEHATRADMYRQQAEGATQDAEELQAGSDAAQERAVAMAKQAGKPPADYAEDAALERARRGGR